MNDTTKIYEVDSKLLQAIVTVLEELPARSVRTILNSIEILVTEQNKPPVAKE